MLELTAFSNLPKSNTSNSKTIAASKRFANYGWTTSIFLLLCVSRIAGLTRQSLWYDEGYTYNLASAPNLASFLKTFAGYTTSEHLQPVYYVLMFLWSRFAGTSDFALRLPSALFSAASCFAVYDLCRRLPQIRRPAFPLIATAIMAASSFSIYYAQEARPYALLQALSLWIINLWIRRRYVSGHTRSSRAIRAAFVLLCCLCALASAFTALLVFSLALADWIADRTASRWLRDWSLPAVLSTTCLSTYLGVGLRLLPGFVAKDVTAIRQPLWMNIGYTLYGVLFGTTFGPPNSLLRGGDKLRLLASFWPSLLFAALAVFAIAAGAGQILRKGRGLPAAARPLALAAGIYAFVFLVVFGVAGHLNILPRHASALFTLLATLTLLCAASIDGSGHPDAFSWMPAGIAAWLAINLVSIYCYRYDPSFGKDDYRLATKVIRDDNRAPAFLVEGQPRLMEHYGASVIDASDVLPQDLSSFLRERSDDAPEIRLVVNEYRGYRWDQAAEPVEVVASEYACSLSKHLAYIDVFTCRLKSPMLLSGRAAGAFDRQNGRFYGQ